ncbi:hypothetical protein AVEN_170699-1 [Araneus ventricosus]|uniref:Uncharacterized protein n=1 Tax=Araneus ventricosus TaxID=182803 RepID=A0A4Y2QZY5_ARAVE|nr:hypothetical protein AVEN_170699-1 [Araneus ventricosus]
MARGVSQNNWPNKRTIEMVSRFSELSQCFVLFFPLHVCEQKCVSILFFRLYDKFKRTGSVQGDEKAKVTATSSVATGEAKERVEDFFAANHLLIHLNIPLAKETHTYTIARSNDHAHQVWSQLLEASASY